MEVYNYLLFLSMNIYLFVELFFDFLVELFVGDSLIVLFIVGKYLYDSL